MMEIQWQTSVSASALHASMAIGTNIHCATDDAQKQLVGPAKSIHSIVLELLHGQAAPGWRLLVAMSSEIQNNQHLAEQWLRKVRINALTPARVNRLAGAISDAEAAFLTAYPKVRDQLELRCRPLQDQWLGYGNGLLAHVKRLTEPDWLVEQASAVLVQPLLGGDGYAESRLNRIVVEAVLTNPIAELPEVVRMAWLLSQLQSDLPKFTEELSPKRAVPIVALASLMVSLAAAEVLEQARCDGDYIRLAIEQWQIAIPAIEDIELVLIPWWETYLQTRPAWSIALKALDKMLPSKAEIDVG